MFHRTRLNIGIPTDNVGEGDPLAEPRVWYAEADTLCVPRVTLAVGPAERLTDRVAERNTEADGPADRLTDCRTDRVTDAEGPAERVTEADGPADRVTD